MKNKGSCGSRRYSNNNTSRNLDKSFQNYDSEFK
jgi:hypothetical protein